jgi:two-component system sensor histidine kinase ChvG
VRNHRRWRGTLLFALAVLIVAGGALAGISRLYDASLDVKSEALRVQAEVIAAFLVADWTSSSAISPPSPFSERSHADASILAARIAPIVRRLVPGPGTRVRVFWADGALILDTHASSSRPGLAQPDGLPAKESQSGAMFRSWARVVVHRLTGHELPPIGSTDRLDAITTPEIHAALNGSAMTFLGMENGEEIVSVAVPMQRDAKIEGALVLSTRTGL